METALNKVLTGGKLAREESASLFDAVIRGEMSDVEIAALLVALKLRGETPEENGAPRLHRQHFRARRQGHRADHAPYRLIEFRRCLSCRVTKKYFPI